MVMTNSATKKQKQANSDLTQGSIWKTIVRFSLPILLSYLLQNFYSVADAAICGYTLSASEVAGVNDTNSISFIFLQFAFGCTAGMSEILSTRIGRNDSDGVRNKFVHNKSVTCPARSYSERHKRGEQRRI